MKAESYINLAKDLFNEQGREEYIRCSISRYYYGLLHTSIDKLITLDSENKDLKDRLTVPIPIEHGSSSIHTSTISSVKSYNSLAGGNLDIVRELRVISDYNFEKSILNYPLEITKNEKHVIKKFNDLNEVLSFLESTLDEITKLKVNAKSYVVPLNNKIIGLEKFVKKSK